MSTAYRYILHYLDKVERSLLLLTKFSTGMLQYYSSTRTLLTIRLVRI
jgi:hypothetical protein